MITFGRYRIVHRIASGGMAEVYRAIAVGEGGFEKEVVLKRIRPELAGDPRFGAMFVEEARLAATLSHANIVQVLDFGRVDGEYFLTLESVRGRDLRQVLDLLAVEKALLPLDLAVLVAVELARALDYAHRRKGTDGRLLGLVHRDISPHNVLLSFEGEVKLADFGIAKVLEDDHQTETGALKGKVAYMSPEQASGAPVDQRSDLFSFGVLLYVLFTGVHPFAGGGALEILERVKRGEVPPPRRGGERLPVAVEAVIERCLARSPGERLASAAELLRALESVAQGRTARATATDLSAFMKGRFPYEVPLPIVALDRLVEQELRLESTDDGLATFTAVAAPAVAAASAAAPPALAPAAAAAAAPAPGDAATANLRAGRQPQAAPPPTRAPRGRATAAAVLLVVLVGAAVALWLWLPASPAANGTAGGAPPAAVRLPAAPPPAAPPPAAPLPAAPLPAAPPPATAPAPGSGSASAPSMAPGTTAMAPSGLQPPLRPRLPLPGKARPPTPPRLAGRGYARFRTEPAYAEVWIAGARRCNTPCTLELAAGTYPVRLVNPTLKREVARTLVVAPVHTRERPAEVSVPGFR